MRPLLGLPVILLIAALWLAACKPREETEARGLNLPQSELLTLFERKSGLIAYIGLDGNVYVVDQAGGSEVQITDDASVSANATFARYYNFPTWSPDSQKLGYVSISGTGQDDITSSIFVSNTDSSNQIEVYSGDKGIPIYFSWSPDSSNLSFIASIPGGDGMALRMVSASGENSQVIDVGAPFYWDWLPDASGMVVHTGGSTQQSALARLALLSLGEGVIEEGLFVQPSYFQSPELSPDGMKLLVSTPTDDGKNALVITDRLGVIQSAVATFGGSTAFSWSPDGKRVALIHSEQPATITRGKLSFVDADSDQPSALRTVALDDVIAFYWSPDSTQVVLFVPVRATSDEQSETAGQATRIFLKMYTADAKTAKTKLLATFNPSDDFLRTLPYFDQYSRSSTIWSPDTRNLVVSAIGGDGLPGIFVVPASGNTQPRPLAEGTLAFWSWR